MKIHLLTYIAVIISLSVFSQTPEQLTRVKKETNSAKLLADANIYRQQSEEQKALAVQAALQNGWPVKISNDSSLVEIQRLDENGQPIYYITENAVAAITTGTNYLLPGGSLGLDLDGTGLIIGEWDGAAVFTSHDEFNNTPSSRVTQKDAAVLDHWHATHVAGTLIGAGLDNVNADAKGMAPNASVYAYDWTSDDAEMAFAAAEYGLLISNHSYGSIA